METFEIERDDARPLRFKGEMIATASSKTTDGPGSQRWRVLHLYRTAAGTLVAERIGRTIWIGERDRHEAQACATEAEVVEYLGLGDTAKEIYYQAQIDISESID
ncbi:MAG: hypothetical protein OZ924_17810 [Burkholderiaceae bacterium]|jgi:hypothetical protein|nr:hypothetical protein [Burkholderiaceae bacterium]